MPRENSFSDEGRSITPDLEEAYENRPHSPEDGFFNDSTLKDTPESSKTQATSTVSAPPDLDATLSPNRPPIRPTFASTPGDRFRASVHKVIRLHRASSAISSARGGIGAEPGVDPRRESAYINYGHIRQNCLIEVVDYSSIRHSFGRMTNKQFVDLVNDPKASKREPWVKVRWINVGGISWDVISAVAIKHDLHPLALEDVLSQRTNARSKADYYPKHLFLRMLCHSLGRQEDPSPSVADTLEPAFTDLPRSSSPGPMSPREMVKLQNIDGALDMEATVDRGGEDSFEDEKTMFGSAPTSRFSTKRGLRKTAEDDIEGRAERAGRSRASRLGALKMAARRQRARDAITIEELKKGQRVNVKLDPMQIFLTRDGTVISFHPNPSLEFTAPIISRLRQRDTGLRTSADPSLLVQSLLDLIVDQALEVVDEYHGKILKLEHDVLLRPKMKTVRHLHILSGDLTLHKRTLEPIRTVIYGLRRYDQDRAAALVDTSKMPPGFKVQGFMSHKANIYLADVLDHMEFILTSLDMFAGISENLINYTFNMASYEMNEVMRRLTLATIIFLPLTLLTGYFGMNFASMWSINNHSDVVFWAIALPVMAIVIPMFTYPDLIRMWHYVQKKLLVKNTLARTKQD